MWRPFHSAAVSLVFLVSGGCNSSLEEYRCSETSDCINSTTTNGRCEQSGHCSFVDTSCSETGFRFGESSGGESGQCVSDANEVDAGSVVDAKIPGLPPIARILRGATGLCGTSLTVDGIDSEAFEGATIESYTWTLLSGNSEEIDTFTGAGEVRLERGLHRLGGDYRAPTINLPNYHGFAAVRANVVPMLDRTTIFQGDIALSNQPYRLFFAVGMERSSPKGSSSVIVQLVNSSGTVPLGTYDVLRDSFTGHTSEFTIPQEFDIELNTSLSFRFEGEGDRWLDNVALVGTLNGNVVNRNESFETGQEDPWVFGDGILPLGGLSVREIESDFREEESYSVTLRVTDSNGLDSEIAEIAVVGEDCDSPF